MAKLFLAKVGVHRQQRLLGRSGKSDEGAAIGLAGFDNRAISPDRQRRRLRRQRHAMARKIFEPVGRHAPDRGG
ncbi:MAG TPA: hypothetical protein VN157_11055, partial [Caulobacter sp.]|nr:hypothetical protein [Caulobacter sp.]